MNSRMWLLLPLLCASSSIRAQLPETDTTSLPIADPKLATTVVARVGPATITAREFLLSYEFGPAFAKRRKDSKRRYLELMVNEKLLALDAADRGGRSSPDVRRSVSEIEGDLATEELYRDDVLNSVRLSEEEIRDAIAGQRIHYALRWLYASTREEIEEYQRMLAKGIRFDSAFAMQLGDSISADLRSWDATRFKVRTLRPSIAAAVDTLKPRTASAPIEGPDGWYIVALHDVSIDAITTEAEESKQREDARRALTQLKADSLSELYLNRIMLANSPVIERRTFDLLSAYLAQYWLPKEMRAPMLKELSVDQETALSAIADVGRFGKEPLVTMRDRSVTLERFLSWYRDREFVLRLRASSVEAYQLSLQQMVWRMVRDGLLIEKALERGMEKREGVRTQKVWWEDKALYGLAKRKLADSIALDDGTLLKYYRDHLRSYRGTKGDTLSFAAARAQVRNDYFAAEFTRRLLHRLKSLRRKYQVKIYDDALAALPVQNENDPRAIDGYFAKKGGTFPHPAFPAIDYDWQAWE
jgi:hypothetical protein